MMGHLAANPEMRETSGGHTVTTFPLATNRYKKDKDGQKMEVADFHRINTWDGLAKIASKYLQKGMALYLEGEIQNHSFEDKDGQKHWRTEINADRLNIITWKKGKTGNLEVSIEEELVADEK